MALMNLRYQPASGDLAAGGVDYRPVDDLRFDQRGCVESSYPPPHFRGAAVGLLALLRNEGGASARPWLQT